MSDSLDRLYQAVLAARAADPASSRTARLLHAGRSKMAKKLAEEAVEVVIDAMNGDSDAVVRESADTAAQSRRARSQSGPQAALIAPSTDPSPHSAHSRARRSRAS